MPIYMRLNKTQSIQPLCVQVLKWEEWEL